MEILIRIMSPGDIHAARRTWGASEGTGLSYVAESEGEVVEARAFLGCHDGQREYLCRLAVQPDRRPPGLGTRLVDRCLDAIRIAGIAK